MQPIRTVRTSVSFPERYQPPPPDGPQATYVPVLDLKTYMVIYDVHRIGVRKISARITLGAAYSLFFPACGGKHVSFCVTPRGSTYCPKIGLKNAEKSHATAHYHDWRYQYTRRVVCYTKRSCILRVV